MATVRHKRLARGLKQLREASGLTTDQAAAMLGINVATIRRIERAAFMPKREVLRNALDLYGADSEKAAGLVELWNQAKTRGWWTAFGDVFDDTYVGLEDEAETLRSWQALVLPGLLQTEAYIREIFEATLGGADVERWVIARMARKTAINRRDRPLRLHCVFSEAALRQQVGGPEVMADQVSYLITMARRSNVMLQVLPFAAGAHAGIRGAFVLLGFEDPEDPDVAYVESPAGDLYPEDAPTISRLNVEWERLTEAALSPEDTVTMLTDLLKE